MCVAVDAATLSRLGETAQDNHRAAALSRLGETDQDNHLADALRYLLNDEPIRRNEVALQVEVLSRIAGDAELGENEEVGSLVGGTANPFGDFGGVAIKIADRGVDLGKSYAQTGLREITEEVSPSRPSKVRLD